MNVLYHPLAVASGHTLTVARANHLRYQDHGFNWELSDKNAFYSDCNYQGP